VIKEASSLRDPGGYIFYDNGIVYRSISKAYQSDFDFLNNSGLYKHLVDQNYLISHKESNYTSSDEHYKIIEPTKIDFISYPYEWSFSQFKEAALLTLKIQLESTNYGMTLKDATPYNIQFVKTKPLFIDTLSFEKIFNEDYSWSALKQFNEMFLGPLILMSRVDISANSYLKTNINGIPLNKILELLKFKDKLNPFIFFNLIVPNFISSNKRSSNNGASKDLKISKNQHQNIIRSYLDFIESLNINSLKTEWGKYNKETEDEKNDYVINKEKFLINFLEQLKPKFVWDVGANDGTYSRIICNNLNSNPAVFSLDIDPVCVENNYLINKKNKLNLTPLLFDLANPSPSIGWLNQERKNIFSRLPEPQLIVGLALIHHIINLNIKINEIIKFFALTKEFAIIEYIPIHDIKCQQIFKSRMDKIEYPHEDEFQKEIEKYFRILKVEKLNPTDRKLYLLKLNEI